MLYISLMHKFKAMNQITLIVTQKYFDEIKSGVKKTDYRCPSVFNNRLLGVKAVDGKYDPRTDVDSVKFVVGYKSDRNWLIIECKAIRAEHQEIEGKRQTRIAVDLGEILDSNV